MKILKLFFVFFAGCFLNFGQYMAVDNTFGTNGSIETNIENPNSSEISNCFNTADGKIIAIGRYFFNENNFPKSRIRLVKYLNNGTLDTSFGSNGVASSFVNDNDRVNCSNIQQDDKILVAGRYNDAAQFGAFLARFNTNGSLDTTFGSNGQIKIPVINNYLTDLSTINSIALSNDGKILVSGECSQEINNTWVNFGKLLRFNSNGSVDTTFANNGQLLLYYPTEQININTNLVVKILTDNSILCSGSINDIGVEQNIALVKFNENGTSLISSFGLNGVKIINTTTTNNESVFRIIINNDNSMFLFGSSNEAFNAKLFSNGAFDTSFGTNGVQSYPLISLNSVYYQDKLLYAGNYRVNPPTNTNTGYVFTQIDINGVFDSAFNPPSNRFFYDYNPLFQYITGMKIINDKLVTFGSTRVGTNQGSGIFFISRFLLNQNLNVNQNSILNSTPKLYPNPSTGSVNFVFKNETDIIIYDILGQTVFSQNGITKNTLVQSNLKKGFYLVNYSDKFGEKGTLKMVVE